MLSLYNFAKVAISVCLLSHRSPVLLHCPLLTVMPFPVWALKFVALITLSGSPGFIAEQQRLQIVPSHLSSVGIQVMKPSRKQKIEGASSVNHKVVRVKSRCRQQDR